MTGLRVLGGSEDRRSRVQGLALAKSLDKDLAGREKWSRQELQRFRQERLDVLIRHAARNSPFYRDLFEGEPDWPVSLEGLPVVDKEDILRHFDRMVTDPRLTLDRVKGTWRA